MYKISIIMPVFNDEKRLDKSINSFLNQTLKDCELICVNDGSTDNSLEILNDYAKKYSRIKVFTQNNQGSGKARNYGMSEAEGEYIGFLDADDFFIDHNALEKLYDTAIKNNADFVTGNIKLVDNDDKFSPFTALDYYNDYKVINAEEYGIPWSFYKNIYRADFIKNNNIEFPDLLRGQDPVFLAEILSKVNKIYTVPVDVYAYFYVNGANQCNTRKKRFDHMKHYKMVFDYLSDEKFEEIRHKFRYEMIGFIDMMGVEGGRDILDATRQIFKEDNKLLEQFEEIFYFKHKNDELNKLSSLVYKPKVSIIVPVYNVSEFLDESLNSLLNQTFKDFEVICVNDGSTDNSLKILEDFAKTDSRIHVIDKINGGCGSARNRGLKESKGRYIYFFDPDDYIPVNTLEDLYYNAVLNDSDLVIFKIARFIEGQSIEYDSPYFDFDNVFNGVNFNRFTFNYKTVKRYVMNSAFAPWSKLYKKEFLDSYDDFQFDLGLSFDDVPFHVKSMLRANKISFVPKFLYNYRYQNQSSVNHTSSKNIDIFKIIDIVEKFLNENNYFEELKQEFYEFKVTHISYYIESSGSQQYFIKAQQSYSKIDKKYILKLNNHLKMIYKFVLESENLQEFQSKIKINSLENKLNKLESEVRLLNNQKKKLLEENNELKDFNNNILMSNSWKITKPLRKFKRLFKEV